MPSESSSYSTDTWQRDRDLSNRYCWGISYSTTKAQVSHSRARSLLEMVGNLLNRAGTGIGFDFLPGRSIRPMGFADFI